MAMVCMPLAAGFEEIEAVIAIDVWRRAGWSVDAVGLEPGPVVASRRVRLLPDNTWNAIEPDHYDLMALPGGRAGAIALSANPSIQRALRNQVAAGKWLAAICAAPLALGTAGILRSRRYTCFPGVQEQILDGEWVNEPVVSDGRIITSQGPGTAFAWALAVVAALDGPAASECIRAGLLL